MEILTSPAAFKAWRANLVGSLGFVPTMGALHAGHGKLLRKARQENDFVALSIFVNPTQFNDKKDLQNYPKTWDEDLKIAREIGVDAIFFPEYSSMYPDDYAYVISENNFSKDLCGASREGHFDGVLSVVMKLLNITSPTNAYFGEKDFQQLTLIKGMAQAFFMDVAIIGVPTERAANGLALSSRNIHLNARGLEIAPKIFETISNENDIIIAQEKLEALGFKIDYLKDIDNRRYIAVFCYDTNSGNPVRLIDNVQI